MRYFVAVAEELHFGRAARRLNLSQPPLSVQVRELEREIGAPLLIRSSRRVELTAAGEVLLGEARKLIAKAEAAANSARRAAQGEIGRLAIGFVTTADYSLLPSLVRRFRTRRPDVRLALRELTADRQLEQLAAGELDLGLMIAPPISPELAAQVVLRETLIAALPTSSRLARSGRHLAIADLAREAFVLFPRPMAPSLYDAVISCCRQAGFSPRLAQEAIQMQTILGLVAAGLGVSLVPACMAKLRRPGVAYLRLDRPGPPIETAAVWRADDHAPTLAALISALPRTPAGGSADGEPRRTRAQAGR